MGIMEKKMETTGIVGILTENQMEKKMENEMEAGIMYGFIGFRVVGFDRDSMGVELQYFGAFIRVPVLGPRCSWKRLTRRCKTTRETLRSTLLGL